MQPTEASPKDTRRPSGKDVPSHIAAQGSIPKQVGCHKLCTTHPSSQNNNKKKPVKASSA